MDVCWVEAGKVGEMGTFEIVSTTKIKRKIGKCSQLGNGREKHGD